ncbi:probable aquaporin NIP5-1 isoform X4 [Morus notabilis]|uniref:probable aquaporin NIP5-1 isoform X4 n=1 Tax=Morus notabilis TaxID=981085 RepID=UPI000CED2FB7|nr:probable aquaporin NIP5-1 isoform X4 [Morus notabilis]
MAEITSVQNPGFKCFPEFNVSPIRKLGAEFIGTFIMIFAAAGAPIVNQKYNGAEMLIGNATSAALAVMVVIFSTGHISGAHLNPAVTIAFAALRHFPWSQVVPYIVVQVLASISASFALKGVFHPFMSGGVTVPAVSHGHAFALEFIVTFILMFIITAVATDTRAVGELAGIAIGATVLLDNLIAGCLNESCKDSGSGNCGWELQRSVDLHGGTTTWSLSRGSHLHSSKAFRQETTKSDT